MSPSDRKDTQSQAHSTARAAALPPDAVPQGWLIYREHDYLANKPFADRLVAAAARHGLALHPVFHETLAYGVERGRLFAEAVQPQGAVSGPAFAIQRAVDPFLAQHLELMGARVYNRASVSGMCNDKAWTYQAVSGLGVPMLPTVFADRDALPVLEGRFSWPVVVKAVEGRSGKQVHLAENVSAYRDLCTRLPQGRYVLQPMCGRPGTDIRVFVVAGEVVAAIRRQSSVDGSAGFRANFSLGGHAQVHVLSERETEWIRRITAAFDFDYVGIDFLLDEEGAFLFNEIEDAVGSRTLSVCTDIDIADLFLAHVRRSLSAGA